MDARTTMITPFHRFAVPPPLRGVPLGCNRPFISAPSHQYCGAYGWPWRARRRRRPAIAQGRVAAGSINILAKKPDDWSKGLILCGIVEFYAILSLLASMLMLLWL